MPISQCRASESHARHYGPEHPNYTGETIEILMLPKGIYSIMSLIFYSLLNSKAHHELKKKQLVSLINNFLTHFMMNPFFSGESCLLLKAPAQLINNICSQQLWLPRRQV